MRQRRQRLHRDQFAVGGDGLVQVARHLLHAAQRRQQLRAVRHGGHAALCATASACLVSLLRACRSISSRRGATSVGLASMALPSSAAISSLGALVGGQLRQRQQGLPVLRVLAPAAPRNASWRLRASCRPGPLQPRLAAAAKNDGSIASAFSKLLRAAALFFCSSCTRPRRFAATGLSGCLASSLSIAASALSNSLRRRCALISARSAVAPGSDSEMLCSSSSPASVWPLASWVTARAVRLRASSGSSFSALAKYSSAFFASPFCR